MYIFWFLHQTTTYFNIYFHYSCCISFDSYIKPQLSYSYLMQNRVVYLLIPTSNHNLHVFRSFFLSLYIFWFLHQTTTNTIFIFTWPSCISFDSYIKPQLHLVVSFFFQLYIFWFLHQTTTSLLMLLALQSCISFDSYIKPQLILSFNP